VSFTLKVLEQKAFSGVRSIHPFESAKNTVKASTANFLILVLVLSVPFYIIGATGSRLPGMSYLPASALMGFVPAIAALILIYRQHGGEGAVALLKSAIAYRLNCSAGWILIALLFMPVVCVVEFGILRLAGNTIPIPEISLGLSLFYFAAFFIAAIGEELGWQGYAYPSLRNSHTAFSSALILGGIWALWHLVPLVEMGRSTNWIFWHLLCTVLLRLIIVWLYENTGQRIIIAVIFHTMINLTWALFPIAGSF
jgi:uncharacterized protein